MARDRIPRGYRPRNDGRQWRSDIAFQKVSFLLYWIFVDTIVSLVIECLGNQIQVTGKEDVFHSLFVRWLESLYNSSDVIEDYINHIRNLYRE